MAANAFGALSLRRSLLISTMGNPKPPSTRRNCNSLFVRSAHSNSEQLLVVVGGGPAGIFGAIRAKSVAPGLRVVVVEKGRLLSKVKISGGGRCNVTNGHYVDKRVSIEPNNGKNQTCKGYNLKTTTTRTKLFPLLAGDLISHPRTCSEPPQVLFEHYPRGYKELRGSFFDVHGPQETISWFNEHGVHLKIEDDGRVFPVTDCSSTIVDCLLNEARRSGVELQTGKIVTTAYCGGSARFILNIEKLSVEKVETVEADYILIATGSSRQGYATVVQLDHSIVQPVPSLFTFKIEDTHLRELSGITFPKVKARLTIPDVHSIPQFTQVGPMLVTHWGLSGPAVLRLSAWGARDLFKSNYSEIATIEKVSCNAKLTELEERGFGVLPVCQGTDIPKNTFGQGTLTVDFLPDFHIDDVKSSMTQHKSLFAKQKLLNSCPRKFNVVKRFWKYLVEREGVDGEALWAHVPHDALSSIALLMKQCAFSIAGKGQFKDEFVAAGGVPLTEISLTTMESQKHPGLFFAGEVLNVDGITGGFNFQNAWTGGYIAGTSIGRLASNIMTNPNLLTM